MRPPVLRHISMARSTAQSECGELSTGTNISRYTATSPSDAARAGFKTQMSVWMPSELGICRRVPTLSRNLFTSRGDDLSAGRVPNRNRVHRARVTGTHQRFAVGRVEHQKGRRPRFIQREGSGSLGDAVAEPDAERAVDAHPQLADGAILEVAHIPSNPHSLRALSMIAGVISAIPRSRA